MPAHIRSDSARSENKVHARQLHTADVSRNAIQEQLDRRSQQQKAVAELGTRAFADENLSAITSHVATTAAQALDVKCIGILELSADGNKFLLIDGIGWKQGCLGTICTEAQQRSLFAYTLDSQSSVLVADHENEDRFESCPLLEDHGFRSSMSVIIAGFEGPYGVLSAHSTESGAFDEDDVVFLESIANVLAATARRKQLETESRIHREELLHVSRLSALGELTTGLAHELNQPLTAIAMYAASCQLLLKQQLSRGEFENLSETIEKIKTQSLRAGAIVARLKKLVMKQQSEHVPFDINDAVRDVVSLVELYAKENGVRIRLDMDELPPSVTGDAVQIQQVLLNLIRNAIDAMSETAEGKRELTIQTVVQPGQKVEVAVCDAGAGIPSEHRGQIFEQFFTTKRQGLGIGLSISRTIIESHGGEMDFDTEIGVGSTFRFTLPATKAML